MKLSKQNENCQISWVFHSVSQHLQMPHLVGLINQLTSKSQLQLWPGTKVRQQLTVSYWPGADPQPEPEPKPESESESGLKNLFFTGRAYFRDDIWRVLGPAARRQLCDWFSAWSDAMRCHARCEVEWSWPGLRQGLGVRVLLESVDAKSFRQHLLIT